MSLEVTCVLTCDGPGCNARREAPKEYRFGSVKIAAQKLRHEALMDGWETFSRGRYYTEAHYCPACKDRPTKPIPRPKRPKKKRQLPPTTIFGGADDVHREGEGWKDKPGSGEEWKEGDKQ